MSSPQKISQLTTAGPLTGAELVPIVQNGGTLQTTVSVLAAFAVVSISPVVSALGTQIAQVSAIAAANATAITSVQADVSALDVRVASVSAVTSVNSAAITSINNVVSALDVRVSTLEIAVSNIGNVSAIAALVTAVASLEGTVSALVIRVGDVSAVTSVNSAAITSINAVVSTKANRVGDFLDSVQYIEFDTSTSFAASVGRLTWDITHGTLDLGLVGGNANLLLGQREVVYCFNNSAATLVKGKVVKVTGASGQKLTVDLAQADSDMDSATILGVMLEDVSVNASGFVATDGVVNNVNTNAFTDGQIVYLSPVSAGELTATKPVAPQHLVQMGYVVKGGSVGGGSVYIKVQNGYELGELHDVKTSASTSLADGEVLAYNTSAGVWTNSTALLDTQASVSALNIQVAAVSALTSTNAVAIAAVSAALTSTNNVVSALEIRVSAISATDATNVAAITSINTVVSVLEVRVSEVSAAVVSANAVIAAVSALTSVNAVAIAAVSALVSANTVAIAAVSASVSALQVQVNAVSVSVGQRVLKAGDTMTGALDISTSADAQAVSVAGYATFTSRVSISAGFYTGEQNYQDNLATRPKFKDYSLQAVVKTSVSATTTLDLTEGNFFTVLAGGSTTYVFANPPVSSTNGPAAGGFVLELQNGGAATVTWPSTVDWPGGTAPTLTASGFDVIVCITDDGGTNWRCVQSMKDSK